MDEILHSSEKEPARSIEEGDAATSPGSHQGEYEVKLEIFEGPLELLLHLIHKNEVDIFDIPIAIITDQYIDYINMMKALNFSLAGDFFVMASTLMHIKSKMLLPASEDEDEEDPRIEITRPLMEYLRLREVAGELTDRDILERDVFTRQMPTDYLEQIQGEESLLNVSLFQLIDAFKRMVEERLPGEPIKFLARKWSLKDKMTFILNELKTEGAVFFIELFKESRTIAEFIITFLALLELVQLGLIKVYQPAHDSDIKLEGKFKEKEDDRG